MVIYSKSNTLYLTFIVIYADVIFSETQRDRLFRENHYANVIFRGRHFQTIPYNNISFEAIIANTSTEENIQPSVNYT